MLKSSPKYWGLRIVKVFLYTYSFSWNFYQPFPIQVQSHREHFPLQMLYGLKKKN
jgi:hypothetical protein